MKVTLADDNLISLFLSQLSTFGWKGSYDVSVADKNKLTIHSESIMTLNDYLNKNINKINKNMSYDNVEQMILYLGNQMIIMAENNKGILFFRQSCDDIIILDNEFCFISDLTHVVPINNKEQLTLNYPLKIEGFTSPELENVTSLPVNVSITSSYYSLALLCVKCLGLGLVGLDLGMIKNTRMYFFLKRCLETEPDKRFFLYL
jgi:hypothetical protein